MTLEEIKQTARDQNNKDLYIAIEMLCDYIKELELLTNNKPMVNPAKDIKKKGTQNG
jgi:hypothetical protein